MNGGVEEMKKGLSIWLVALASTALLASSAWAVTFINLATGTTGGMYYPVGAAMVKIWNENVSDIRASVQSTGGTVHNIQLMGNGEAEAGFMDHNYYSAYNGLGKWEGNPQRYIRGVVPLYPEPVQLMVAPNSGIKTVYDLKGKKVSIGAVASGTEVTARQLLNLAGIDPDKDIKAENLGVGDTGRAFADRLIDAAIMMGALGQAGVVEATTLGVAYLIDIPDEIIKKAVSQYPYWFPFTIPAGIYKGQGEPIKTYAGPNIIAVHEKLPEDLVYQMTKALFEHKEDLIAVTPQMEHMVPENVEQIVIPLHPGAERYYKEIGVLK